MPIPNEILQAALRNWRGPGEEEPAPDGELEEQALPPPDGPSPFTPPSLGAPGQFDPSPPELEHGGGIPQAPLEVPTDYWRPPPPQGGPPVDVSLPNRHVPVFRPGMDPGLLLRLRGG